MGIWTPGPAATAGDDTFQGDSAPDVVDGLAGDDSLHGGDGDDVLTGGLGRDFLDGGAGADIASYANALSGVYVAMTDLSHATGDAAGDIFVGIENIRGSGFNDILSGNDTSNVLEGGAGDDTLIGLGGADRLDGGDGNDIVYVNRDAGSTYIGGAGVDTIVGIAFSVGFFTGSYSLSGTDFENAIGTNEDNTISGDQGANMLSGLDGQDVLIGGGGADILNGGAGFDRASYGTSPVGVYAYEGDFGHATGDAAGDTLISIECLTGSAFNDVLGASTSTILALEGGGGDDILYGVPGVELIGGDGYDVGSYANSDVGVTVFIEDSTEELIGSAFNDTITTGIDASQALRGGDGDDFLDGSTRGDILDGGNGSDTASYVTAFTSVYVFVGDFAHATGDAAGDKWFSIENVTGSNFDDVLGMDAGANILNGGAGNDVLFGMGGDDTLIGGAGNDLYGYFGPGWGHDTVTTFEDGADKVDFTRYAGLHFSDLTLSQQAGGVLVTHGLDTILLGGTTLAQIDANDFLFAPSSETANAQFAAASTANNIDAPASQGGGGLLDPTAHLRADPHFALELGNGAQDDALHGVDQIWLGDVTAHHPLPLGGDLLFG